MRKNKHFMTVVCLIVGLVILTTAAFANYDNANGYTAYKNAVKDLMYAQNFSATMSANLSFNGRTLVGERLELLYDYSGAVSEYTATLGEDGPLTEHWIANGSSYTRFADRSSDGREVWNIHKSYSKGQLSGLYDDAHDRETADKVIRFVELLADTFVGDLKNNFVLVSNEGGNRTYQINLQGNQIPELVNAGISMIYSSMVTDASASSRGGYVTVSETYAMTDDEKSDELGELIDEAYEKLEENGYVGVYVITGDGRLKYYETEEDYIEAEQPERSLSADLETALMSLGDEPKVEKASCYLTLDSEGRLIYNRLSGTLSGTDASGEVNSVDLTIEGTISEYGTTKIAPPPAIPDGAIVNDYR
ncbi:hypothetical protein LJC34_05315 [Oscillospiraceae bacterium OttesenSCG-928-G22]|nr:hypothetical protein [Oscillospiraceae bacterium OttesenSCG-928-G22]